ncbi:MAG: T9SS type A sorting domain-containing protein [Bacteroidetes bacterium]|nr:T9SS type A sorting domain-containing protein [Bacteroidota bacterium]
MRHNHFFSLLIFFAVTATMFAQSWQTYPYTPPNCKISFPIDDGKHTSSSTSTEWWYLNLHIIGSAPNYKVYDVMLCYFSKPATMRIFNIATPNDGTFHTDVNITQFVFSQQTGKWDFTYTIPPFISDYSKWTYPTDGKTFSYNSRAKSIIYNDELNVNVISNRAPLIVGEDGFIAIGEQGDSSYYYSYSNMKVTGTIKFAGVVDTISSGIAWIDRQYGPFTVGINPDNYYEWFSLQLDKPGTTPGIPQTPSEFNIWQIFSDTNSIPSTPSSRLVSAMYDDDSQDTCSTFIFERTGYWHDQVNNKYYSSGWRFINPLRGINVEMTPLILNQLTNVVLFKFWEGGTSLKGTIGGKPVSGNGFAELVAGRGTNIFTPSVPTSLQATAFQDHYSLSWQASTAGSFPLGGYRVYRSATNEGYWEYIGTTTNTYYDDFSAPASSGYYYTVSSFDNQSAKSASKHANAVWVNSFTTSLSEGSIVLIPNPTEGVTTVYIPSYSKENTTTLELFSANGKRLNTISITSSATQLDLSTFSEGVYIVKIIDNNGVSVNRIIKE